MNSLKDILDDSLKYWDKDFFYRMPEEARPASEPKQPFWDARASVLGKLYRRIHYGEP